MVHSRGCGKELRESEKAYPHCGAPHKLIYQAAAENDPQWAPTSFFVSGILLFFAVMSDDSEEWDPDTIHGVFVLGLASILGK